MKTENFNDIDRDSVVEDDYLPSGVSTPVEDTVLSGFERDVEDARSIVKRYESSSDVERNKARRDFVNDRYRGWGKHTKNDNWNFLHHLAHSKFNEEPSLQWLMARAISKLPELMGEMDAAKRIPLTVALSAAQPSVIFVYTACKNTTPKTKKLIGEALKSECNERDNGSRSTCLHWAIQQAINPELIAIMTGFVPMAMFTTKDSQGRTPLHLAVEYERCSASQPDVVRALLARGQAALDVNLSSAYGQCNVYQHHEYTRRETELKTIRSPRQSANNTPAYTDGEAEQMISSVQIKDMLKFMYLRNRMPLEASECLHVQGQPDKLLWFDFGLRANTTITESTFNHQFGHLEFDRVLQYVAFPWVAIERKAKSPKQQPQGRNDMCFFFDWLRKKGVQRIIKVEVDDMSMPYHTDEAIVEALKSFGVEVLDWSKPDLSPLVLSRLGGRLREVSLRWSGQDAALTSWSGPEGLSLIPTLGNIEIRFAEQLESLPKTKSNLAGFETRLQNSWSKTQKSAPTINICPMTGGGHTYIPKEDTTNTDLSSEGLTADPESAEPLIGPHRWLETMEGFVQYYRQMKIRENRKADPIYSSITVALIDDGVDINHPNLSGRQFSGKSFDFYDDKNPPYWESTTGHGTLMARLIFRLCPSANIYVIRLRMIPAGDRWQIDPRTAAKAIDHAAEIGAHIISMSWIAKQPEDQALKMAFEQAVFKAQQKKCLMFCAASDSGKSHEPTYPHAVNPSASFRIGAATALGSTADFVTNDKTVDYVFPGQDVLLHENFSLTPAPKSQTHNGSSVATALAAGLAALVMECVRLGIIFTMEEQPYDRGVIIKMEEFERIRTKQAMEYAFNSMTLNRSMDTSHKYIEVWDTFTDATENMARTGYVYLDQLEVVSALARLFLRTGVKWYPR